jgi:hypothetical protein
MEEHEVRDTLAAEFFLHRIRTTVNECEDINELRDLVVQLVDLIQRQKAVFRQLMGKELDLDL